VPKAVDRVGIFTQHFYASIDKEKMNIFSSSIHFFVVF
jgi:hypothetical protein